MTAGNVLVSNDSPLHIKQVLELGTQNTPFMQIAQNLNGVRLASGQDFEMSQVLEALVGSQTGLSENDSLAGPSASFVARTAEKNQIQIFQEKFLVSDFRASQTAGLSYLVEGESVSPEELQLQQALRKIYKNWDYSALNGTKLGFTNSTTDITMGGILTGVKGGANGVDASGAALDLAAIEGAVIAAIDNGTEFALPYVVTNATVRSKIVSLAAAANKYTPVQGEVGLAADVVALGGLRFGLVVDSHVPGDEILFADMSKVAPVILPVRGQEYQVEELARTGAGSQYLITAFGSVDYGSVKAHAALYNFI